jgi:ATP/maltotriose-dependent transcriptional regulator MalT
LGRPSRDQGWPSAAALSLSESLSEALAVSVQGERHIEAGLVRVTMPEIFRTRGDILRSLERLDEADDAYRRAVTCARAQGARSLELRALSSLLDLSLAHGDPGDACAELLRAMDAMPGQGDRPDLAAASALLARVRGGASPREKLSSL